jgi:hypothetical protein
MMLGDVAFLHIWVPSRDREVPNLIMLLSEGMNLLGYAAPVKVVLAIFFNLPSYYE